MNVAAIGRRNGPAAKLRLSLGLIWAVLIAVPCPARAWGPEGHAIVADIAQRQVAPQTRAVLGRLLGPGVTLAAIANDADEYRNRCANTGPWHYVNIPIDAPAYDPVRHCPAGRGCVLSVLQREIAVLKDHTQPDVERAFALRWVVHFVGDLHQPLHSADRGDRGGNDVKLRFRGRETNLHRLWDEDLMRAMGRTRAGAARAGFDARATQQPALRQGSPLDWALEARELARRLVYGLLPAPSGRGIEIGDAYVRAVRDALDLQLLRAGVRLAMVLDDALTHPGARLTNAALGGRHVCEPGQRRANAPGVSN